MNDQFLYLNFGATAILLLLVLHQLRKIKLLHRQVHILASLTEKLSQQNKTLLQQIKQNLRPEFAKAGVAVDDKSSRIDVKVVNKGQPAIVEKVVTSSPDIEFLEDRFFPLRIEQGELFMFTGFSKGGDLSTSRYVIQIHHTDVYGNPYMAAINGEGQITRLVTQEK